MVGIIEDTRKIITQGFKSDGDLIAVLGITRDDLAASEYSQTIEHRTTEELIEAGVLPEFDLSAEKTVQDVLLALSDEMLVKSAHDCSEGGLAVAIAECCFSSLNREAIGARIDLKSAGISDNAVLFGESPSRIVISFAPENLPRIREVVGDCPFEVIGSVGDDQLLISIDGRRVIAESVVRLEAIWESALESALGV
jgi:phosphoribosylformylglycinamidine synthase